MGRRKHITYIRFLVLVSLLSVFVCPTPASTAISVSVDIPDEYVAARGAQIVVPVEMLTDVSGMDVFSYQFDVTYDPSVLTAVGIIKLGTRSQSWAVLDNHSEKGRIRIVGYGATPLQGTGTLIHLVFDVVDLAPKHSALTLTNGQFNEGDPLFSGDDGLLRVPPPPTAGFSASDSTGYAPLSVGFNDLSDGIIDTWKWDFGDENVSNIRNPLHTYKVPGVYDVSLTVEGPGGTDSITIVECVMVEDRPPLVIADFSAIPRSGYAPLTVQFNDNSSGEIVSREWTFGDGTTSTKKEPEHIYAEPGLYTVKLVVSDSITTDAKEQADYITVEKPASSEKQIVYLPELIR